MTCEKLISDFLLDYVDGKLPMATRLSFDLHLSLCRDCRNYLHNYRQTVLLTRSVACRTDEQPANVPPDLVRAILEARKSAQ